MTYTRKWITAEGWSTVHIQWDNRHSVDDPNARWTLCGLLVRRPLPSSWDDKSQCGRCVRRRAAS